MPSVFLAILNLAVLASAATTNTNLQTAFPASSGTSALAAVKTIAAGATFDGGVRTILYYSYLPKHCLAFYLPAWAYIKIWHFYDELRGEFPPMKLV